MKTPGELAEEWITESQEGAAMQQYEYWDGAYYGFLAGYKAAMAELEQREREAFEAAQQGDWHRGNFYPTLEKFEDYKKSKGEA